MTRPPSAHETRTTLALLLTRDLVLALDAGCVPDEEEQELLKGLPGNRCQSGARP